MKKIAFILLAFALVCSCGEKNLDSVELAFLSDSDPIEFEATDVEIEFTCPTAWTARSNGSWATIQNKSGEGSNSPQSLKVSVTQNDGDNVRTAVIMLTCDSGSAMFNLSQRAKNPTKVRLLYWNIQDGMWADQENNYEDFLEWIKSYDPDICVWNEGATLYKTNTYTGMTWRTGTFPDGWPAFAKKYGHEYCSYSYITPNKNVGYDHFPQVITTRNAPIKKVADFIGSAADTIITRRGAWQEVDIAGHKINFITLHLWPFNYDAIKGKDAGESNEIRAAYQKGELMYMFKRSILTDPKAKDGYWICLGDFNSRSRIDQWHYNYSGDMLHWFTPHDYIAEATPLLDVMGLFHEGEFHTSTYGNSRIDFVYATPRLMKAVVDVKVPIDNFAVEKPVARTFSNGTLYDPSDHRPILVDFEIR